MATIPPVNYGALKVSFPANLPRNEKDLICMLLAGRLKDLWKGKLICAQLAIDDLIKDLTGVSALSSLREGLTKLKGSLDSFKRESGYDKILGSVNQALGQVSTVFSLGGLCPSPVTPPKIPDVLATLNQNLFGQANGILNALAQASNPKVCLGGGGKGFSLDWSKVTGDLKVLKTAIGEFKKNPAGFNNTMKAFESNIRNQSKRLNSEVKRLQQNLTDPLGINEKRNLASNVKRVKAISDGFAIKDRNGVIHKNPSQTMITGEIEYVLSRSEPRYVTPIKYVTKPVYDYCGNFVGYTREAVTGDPEYLGHDTFFTELNIETPTPLPRPTYKEFDFFFKEENGQIKVYNTNAEIISSVNLERGKHYRIGVEITTSSLTLGIYYNNELWKDGILITREPLYGSQFEVCGVEGVLTSTTVEIDWKVSIENPVTPSAMTWRTSNGQTGPIVIGGITALAEEDKTYDVSMATKKAWSNVEHVSQPVPTGGQVNYEARVKNRSYQVITKIVKDTGEIINLNSVVSYGRGIKILKDKENFALGNLIEGGKSMVITQKISDQPKRYFVMKRFINDDSGVSVSQISCYITDAKPDNIAEPLYIEHLASLQFDEPVGMLNDLKLPYTDHHDYKLSLGSNGKLNDTDESKIEISNINDKKYLVVNLNSNRRMPDLSTMGNNSFVYTSHIELNTNDFERNFTNYNPVENRLYVCFKGLGNFLVECEVTYIGNTEGLPAISTQLKSSAIGDYLPIESDVIPEYKFRQKIYQQPFIPVRINGGRSQDGANDKYGSNSSTPLTIALGSKTLIVRTGLFYTVGQVAIIIHNADNYMIGPVTAYNAATGSLTISATTCMGSGQYSNWIVNLNGTPGPYVYSITPELPGGMIFDVDTGTIRGTPTEQQDRIKYTISIDEEDVNLYSRQFYISVGGASGGASTYGYSLIFGS